VDDKVGSIDVGKDADLVLWDGYPLSSAAVPNKVFIDGDVYFDRTLPGYGMPHYAEGQWHELCVAPGVARAPSPANSFPDKPASPVPPPSQALRCSPPAHPPSNNPSSSKAESCSRSLMA